MHPRIVALSKRMVEVYARICAGLPLSIIIACVPAYTWLWSGLKQRRKMQEKRRINVVPNNFYSNTPSIADIEGSFEYKLEGDTAPYDLGIDDGLARRELQALAAHAPEFSPPSTVANQDAPAGYFWSNSQFGGADAMAYYCYLRRLKPATVLEIGSGYSTLVACEALKANGRGALRCVEPYPRPFLRSRVDVDLILKPAQEITSEFVNDMLKDGDILFIDSTHTVKTGSDCLHIYLRLLPKIRRNIHVHAHDIHLPFGIPQDSMLHKQIHWTEQHLLLAFLLDNPKARILYGSRYNHWRNRDLMETMMGGKAPAVGASFWFEYRGAHARPAGG